MASSDPRYEVISKAIREIHDFPKPGILFYDVTTILLDPVAFKHCIDILVERYSGQQVDIIAGKNFVSVSTGYFLPS
jgi:adenine phosphoribosyltransferase